VTTTESAAKYLSYITNRPINHHQLLERIQPQISVPWQQ